ncbi:hypothetical protein pneo_cds_854 [Pandoravirus neocaledonia]|uniref:Uncharacterized protein n=1 Tax=Pandoravirus neocaledonia TaxID=2107708 RepID=A0A2U7UDC0_9VIRU|nr:hypothetical protein pneo_cds_854 [Pandoravirus neocaledonia]AVK76461.1 hypothetical protein pneo_cds_854 [Pandoravirus neocaledonia]
MEEPDDNCARDGDAACQRLALLVACIDRHRLCADDTLLGACFRRLVAPERLCAAFARPACGAPWTDQTPLGDVLRTHLNFADACDALQRSTARSLSGGPPPISFVACCGCTRPWCAGRPCARGWMLPITERARNRLAAWQWAETIEPGAASSDTAFGGFYTRELVQCTTADLGYRLMPCSQRRTRSPVVDGASQSHALVRPRKRSRDAFDAAVSTEHMAIDADEVASDINEHNAVDGVCDDHNDNDNERDGCKTNKKIACKRDRDTQRGPCDTVDGKEPDVPLVLSCSARGVIGIRDHGMYVAAVITSRRHEFVDRVHPSIPRIYARDNQREGASARRLVRVTGDAFIVRVSVSAPLADSTPWDAQG